MVFRPLGGICDPLLAAAPWAICQGHWRTVLTPSKFDHFNPKALIFFSSEIPKGQQNTPEHHSTSLNFRNLKSTNSQDRSKCQFPTEGSSQAKDCISQSPARYFPDA